MATATLQCGAAHQLRARPTSSRGGGGGGNNVIAAPRGAPTTRARRAPPPPRASLIDKARARTHTHEHRSARARILISSFPHFHNTRARAQLPTPLRRLLAPPGARPVAVTLRRVLPVPVRVAFAVLGDWEAPFMARSSAGVAVKSVDYADLRAAAPLRPGALRELVRARRFFFPIFSAQNDARMPKNR
jgi:hypothetical protein